MAEDHRRVEPRNIVGTGMASDPERIETLLHQRERTERHWRAPPRRGFGEVLEQVPRAAERDDPARPARGAGRGREAGRDDQREAGREDAPSTSPGDDAGLHPQALVPLAEEPADAALGPAGRAALPRVPPDPRMAGLHALLSSGTPRTPSR